MSLDIIYSENRMKIYEIDKVTTFEFECDLILDNELNAHFDDSNVTTVTDLLTEHNITNWQCTLGMNERHQRTVKVQVYQPLNRLFHYDLTTLMLAYK